MPTLDPHVLLAALRLGARPRDLLSRRRLLKLLLDRLHLVAGDDLGAVVAAFARAPDRLVHDLATKHPRRYGGLARMASDASGLSEPLAWARVVARLPVGPGTDRGNASGLVVPASLIDRLPLDLGLARGLLCVSGDGGPWRFVPARDLAELRALERAARVLTGEEEAAAMASLKALAERAVGLGLFEGDLGGRAGAGAHPDDGAAPEASGGDEGASDGRDDAGEPR